MPAKRKRKKAAKAKQRKRVRSAPMGTVSSGVLKRLAAVLVDWYYRREGKGGKE